MTLPPHKGVESDEIWSDIITEARSKALEHGTVLLRISFDGEAFAVECLLAPDVYPPWHELVDMEKKQ